ncbi:MAG: Pantothenate synthetase [Candidatus Bathyarchaeota archaeon BA2]|nr:MAG: Pantothenate synthetase [Candidatus Bathyarchaeota archaeon BA2]
MIEETEISPQHPRAESLINREKLIKHQKLGIVALAGLIAHGRGEAFDYLLGEKTTENAFKAIKTAAATMLLAKHPVISVNGNAAALAAEDIVNLAKVTGSKIEVNLFYRSLERELAIKRLLEPLGAKEILGVGEAASAQIREVCSERRRVNPRGILVADVVLVPLEDGDRTEALRKMGKTVIAIDLNPLSRTAQWASITIVDNVVRALPLLVKEASILKNERPEKLRKIVSDFDNREVLAKAIKLINQRLSEFSRKGVYISEVIEIYQNLEG